MGQKWDKNIKFHNIIVSYFSACAICSHTTQYSLRCAYIPYKAYVIGVTRFFECLVGQIWDKNH